MFVKFEIRVLLLPTSASFYKICLLKDKFRKAAASITRTLCNKLKYLLHSYIQWSAMQDALKACSMTPRNKFNIKSNIFTKIT